MADNLEGLKYVGANGAFLPGIPARDLTADEVITGGNTLRDVLIINAYATVKAPLAAVARLKALTPRQVLIEHGLYEEFK